MASLLRSDWRCAAAAPPARLGLLPSPQAARPRARAPASAANSSASTNTTRSSTPSSSGRAGARFDYLSALARRAAGGPATCPALFLAPMENLADAAMRTALAAAAPRGFDEACTEFIRVPSKATHAAAVVRGVTAGYDACELAPWGGALGAQIMGSDEALMAAAARRLVFELGAPRIDLNCGCPANSVTGNGAGST
jgi:tRNA-dihydrouridine synthase C